MSHSTHDGPCRPDAAPNGAETLMLQADRMNPAFSLGQAETPATADAVEAR